MGLFTTVVSNTTASSQQGTDKWLWGPAMGSISEGINAKNGWGENLTHGTLFGDFGMISFLDTPTGLKDMIR